MFNVYVHMHKHARLGGVGGHAPPENLMFWDCFEAILGWYNYGMDFGICISYTVPEVNHPCYAMLIQTLTSNFPRLTLNTLLIPTVDTTYSDVVLIVCHETSYCDTRRSDVQRSSIWGLGSIGVNVNEVEIGSVSSTQCPVYSDNLSSTDIFCELNTREGRDRGWTWSRVDLLWMSVYLRKILVVLTITTCNMNNVKVILTFGKGLFANCTGHNIQWTNYCN